MTQGDKPICIMDTDTLLFSFKLDLLPMRAIDRVNQRFDLVFPYKVFEEYKNQCKRGLARDYESVRSDIDLFFEERKRKDKIIEERLYSHCLKYLHRWFNLVGMQRTYYELNEGERHCIALSLYMSRQKKKRLFVITDDFDARDAGIDLFICRQRIGLVYSLPGVMILTYLSTKDVTKQHLLGFMTDYFNLTPPRSVGLRELRRRFLEEIELSCREQSFDKCGLVCM